MNAEINTGYNRIKAENRVSDKLQELLKERYERYDNKTESNEAGSDINKSNETDSYTDNSNKADSYIDNSNEADSYIEEKSIPVIPEDIPAGDMPGDKVNICAGHIDKARVIFPELIKELIPVTSANPYGRAVVSVYGGSGVGKSGAAAVLSYMLSQTGIGSYTMSGDNYPRRIPKYNDAERLHIFRQEGMKALAAIKASTPDVINTIQELQRNDDDVNTAHIDEYDWFAQYLKGGTDALRNYLGSPAECDFEEVDSILGAFLDGADKLWLKRMGRDEASLWYEEIDMSDTHVLILEWTHGNSQYLKNIDIPILLNSTPEETLKYRLSRNRDGKTDSPFTTLVLNIEQDKLMQQAPESKIIVTKSGELTDYESIKNN